jgi:anti-sigma factor RsiW
MDCKKIEEIIFTDYIDGKLTAEAMEDIDRHIASCGKCRALKTGLSSVGSVFKGDVRPEVPSGLWEKIRSEITAGAGQEKAAHSVFASFGGLFVRLRPAMVAATAALIVLMALVAIRLAPGWRGAETTASEDYIYSMADLNMNGDDYDLQTGAESYFL